MSFPVIAIAASAGGLEAVSELLQALPERTGMAFLVVQHLDPNHDSLLTDILSKRTAMKVRQAQHQALVEPDHVYVIPPNATLTLKDGDRLHLSPRARGLARHKPGDILFRSLAEARADTGIGIVLSGGDADGALGIQAIKQAGGITFAQDPASAQFPSMPKHAIDTGCVDFVLRPPAIAQELTRLVRHPYLQTNAARPSEAEEIVDAIRPNEEQSLRRVFRRLRSAHGVDFTHYKRSTLRRRLARRMALQRLEDPSDYAALVETDATEAAALYQDFLIRVTGFFRDPESFEGLAQRVFPSLLEGRPPKDPIRVWVPGCATGEEVYSLAMELMEFLGEHRTAAGVQFFGTDISEVAIEKARAGVYLESITEGISPERLKRFFVKQDSHYCIAKSIRDLCIFARHDVTRDPPFSRLDLVSCRNLLIYLDATAQRRVMQTFHYALKPQGFLSLGPSESVGNASDLFELTDKAHRLYTRKPAAPGTGVESSAPRSNPGLYGRAEGTDDSEPTAALEVDSAQREAERLLLARYAPAGVLVDDALNVLHFQGETGPYLEHASGPPSLNLHRIARPQLLMELAPALQEARETRSEVRRDGLSVDGLREVSIQVIPLQRLSSERAYLVLFEDASRRFHDRRAPPVTVADLPESEKDRRLVQAEREVVAMREYLQATNEEHEAVKEELKSAHEEVLSANEEFQSTNEELETSKEELQSSNEELHTTNEELRNRNRELAVLNAELQQMRAVAEHARAYADEIVETVRDPLVVLDGELKVLRANRAFYTTFNTAPEVTEGIALYKLENHQWDAAALRLGLEQVLTHSEPLINWEITYTVPALGERLLLLNARRIAGGDGRAQLILLAIEDITERRAKADSLRESGRRKDEFLAMLAHELRNPLAPLTHTLHVLCRGQADPATMERYEMMERQTQRLVRLVDELLDVARISRGLIELKREPVDLGFIVRDSAKAAAARMEQLRHTLELALPEGLVKVDGDSVRLEQVVSNLLENAAKYTPPGGRIAVTLQAENGEAVLSVRDSGIGLAPDALERIFDLFTQVDSTLARSGGGLGLGLTVVRRVLELHGGRIEAHSAGLGHGSEFVVRLPLVSISDEAVQSHPQKLHADPSVTRRRRVLVVDDNVDATESMALLLGSWGHTTAVAHTAAVAMAQVIEFQPDTALVDIGLPDMDGYELARRIRARPNGKRCLLIAMTGYGRAEDRQAAREAGFDVHLVKPAELTELEALLASER
ncbi:MAG TPA: chemotaxis protein CheB [Steroidobacteraceae bacterium]|nr:chemotaxis protein CheB [Steroidobacteraceae bacterium]